MFRMRNDLDEAQLNVKEKDQHIESLKSVMRELEEQIMEKDQTTGDNRGDSAEIERKYNTEVYGN